MYRVLHHRAQEERHKADVKKFRKQQAKISGQQVAAGKAPPPLKKPPRAPKKIVVSIVVQNRA